jgi:hypothetical protein
LPYIPVGQSFQPTAFRSDIRDVVKAAFPLFFGGAAGVTAGLASAATLALRFTTMGSVWTHFAFHMRRGVAEYRQTSRRNVSACGISGET